MKLIYACLVFIVLSSCQKNYTCVCTTIPANQDTIIDKARTTKIGSKYYAKFCADFENQRSNLKDCHLQ
ncbi:hypothetical protein CNR22_13900 [Sphingobacteriaceae bacterium]|nr:hypothetical protein CNR22_13900 [Sphingobacteriaceae bacterium]